MRLSWPCFPIRMVLVVPGFLQMWHKGQKIPPWFTGSDHLNGSESLLGGFLLTSGRLTWVFYWGQSLSSRSPFKNCFPSAHRICEAQPGWSVTFPGGFLSLDLWSALCSKPLPFLNGVGHWAVGNYSEKLLPTLYSPLSDLSMQVFSPVSYITSWKNLYRRVRVSKSCTVN